MKLYNEILLIKYKSPSIERGKVLICHTKDDTFVSLMLCEVIGESTYHLLVISGYKAGLGCCYFPLESTYENNGCGIDTKWLIDNWEKYGYQNSNIREVMIVDEPNSEIFIPKMQ